LFHALPVFQPFIGDQPFGIVLYMCDSVEIRRDSSRVADQPANLRRAEIGSQQVRLWHTRRKIQKCRLRSQSHARIARDDEKPFVRRTSPPRVGYQSVV
jgi:hypothetical protein